MKRIYTPFFFDSDSDSDEILYNDEDSGSDIIVKRYRSIQLPISNDKNDENNFDECSQSSEHDCILQMHDFVKTDIFV